VADNGRGTGTIEKALVGAVAAAVVVETVKHVGSREARADAQQHDADGKDNGHAEPSGPVGGVKGLIQRVDCYQRAHRWLGFPLATVKKFGEDQAGNLAALISYYTFFSLFPLLLALVTILGFVLDGDPELQRQVVDSAMSQFPVIGDQIRDNIGSLSGNWTALAIGLGGALWAGMGAVDAAQNAMNSVWDVPIREKPNFVKRRLRSLMMLFVLGGAMLATAVLSTATSSIDALAGPLRLGMPLLVMAVNVGVFMIAFRVLTERHLSWGSVFPGAVVGGVAASIFQVVGGFIMDRNLSGASQTYGTFAVVIGLLSWLYLQAQVALYAAEVNVVRARRLWPRGLTQENLTDADRRALEAHAEVEKRIEAQDTRTKVPAHA
jgi:YihY family inner membrane protein